MNGISLENLELFSKQVDTLIEKYNKIWGYGINNIGNNSLFLPKMVMIEDELELELRELDKADKVMLHTDLGYAVSLYANAYRGINLHGVITNVLDRQFIFSDMPYNKVLFEEYDGYCLCVFAQINNISWGSGIGRNVAENFRLMILTNLNTDTIDFMKLKCLQEI